MSKTDGVPSDPRPHPASATVSIETARDGSVRVRSATALAPYPARLLDRLLTGAERHPDRTWIARREPDGAWQRISYGEMLMRTRSVAQALLGRSLGVARPILILSGNGLEHLQLAFGAMWAGIPYSPLSTAVSLASPDFTKLGQALALLEPGLVLVDDGAAFSAAVRAAVPPDVEVVVASGQVEGRTCTPFDALLSSRATADVDAAYAATGPDTIAKLLFTSGSTALPKAVVTTQRMLCANQQMILQSLPVLGEQPPVLVDWLPWNHTFGGSHNVGLALYNGGTYYIDDGKPTPAGFAETLRNLRELSPTVYFNVPRGWEELVSALEADAALREKYYAQLALQFFAGAGLSQSVWDRLDRVAEKHCGRRIPVMTGLGMTETSPSSTFTSFRSRGEYASTTPDVRAGHVGLPCPGCELKLVPVGDKLEARFRGPHVMPGYFRMPEMSALAFDEEGFYRTGDALKFVDPTCPELGFAFDGRIAEDFKLATGTFVSVGPLRARVIARGAPYVQDAVVTGIDRNEVGILVFPRLDVCRSLACLGADASSVDVLRAPQVRAWFQTLVDDLYGEGTGSATRVARACLLHEPPSFERGEITDKNSINQRAVLAQRAALIESLYAGADPDVVLPSPARLRAPV
jgi:feruloyl-CoA synthase